MKQQIASTKLPTLEQAKRLSDFIERPVNNQIVLVGAVAPKVNTSGLIVGDAFQKKAQEDLNRKGLIVARVPESDFNQVKEGEIVLFRPETPFTFSKVVTSDELLDDLKLEEGQETTSSMYKQYVIIVINASDLMLVLNKDS